MNPIIEFYNEYDPHKFSKHELSKPEWNEHFKKMQGVIQSASSKERIEFIEYSMKQVN